MKALRLTAPLLLCAASCAPLRPPSQGQTPYGNPSVSEGEGEGEPTRPAPAPEPDYEAPMGWSVTVAEECGVSFAMPGTPTRSEQARADGVHAVYTFNVDVDTQLSVDCAESPGATPEQMARLADDFARIADRGEVQDLGPFEVAGVTGRGYQLQVKGAMHRYRVVVIDGRRVQLAVIGAHEYPGLAESLRPISSP